MEASLHEFVAWSEGRSLPHNPLSQYSPLLYWCYADYKYMKDMFASHPHLLQVQFPHAQPLLSEVVVLSGGNKISEQNV